MIEVKGEEKKRERLNQVRRQSAKRRRSSEENQGRWSQGALY